MGNSPGLGTDAGSLYTDRTLSVAAVPEPSSYAMFATGLGLDGPHGQAPSRWWLARRVRRDGIAQQIIAL